MILKLFNREIEITVRSTNWVSIMRRYIAKEVPNTEGLSPVTLKIKRITALRKAYTEGLLDIPTEMITRWNEEKHWFEMGLLDAKRIIETFYPDNPDPYGLKEIIKKGKG